MDEAGDAGPMPGQRKRRRQQRNELQRAAARFAPDAGRWEVLFETQDEAAWHAHVRRLRAPDMKIDWTAMRVDRLCGRLTQPTTFRLSLFVSKAKPIPDQDSST
ncbi:hypothetical protein GCM10010503_00290 [Streptomyces lucensis JCM 4490]|uniref:Uncharacterized protein n=1 Tax=Streptomyces lucensis JCM 4490 TaxID=1306176 RepID=A0A918IRW0_9ACTN|nr:hypothetical protein GCM10010503_00290 [Streptomyces lucensis JCM 4490]